ncbi:MAG: peptidase M16 [Rhodospirillaceae bacterium]|nr:peptidase M16 [Rhodospirillaceae bacterium]MAI50060.1 peptidase M16 [Rhodospirillaceae bacterium]
MTMEQATLPGGMQLITDRMGSVETVTLGVWVNVGARNEMAEINGVSHLLEHMAFKGTARRSALDIAVEIENVGGHLNAYTSRESTVYYATVLKENADLALDIVSDILMHSTFAVDELDRERAVVLQEIGQANDTPDDIIFDTFQETAYPDQPLGRAILGTSDIVSRMRCETLKSYMDAQYGGDRMILSAAGNLDHQSLAGLAEKAFAGISPSQAAAPLRGRYTGGDNRKERDLEQAHLVIGFEGVGYNDADYYSLAVLSTALGGGMSSRLFQEVREKRGLVYSIYTFSSAYQDGGLFGLYAGTGAEEVAELVTVVCDELNRVAASPMEDAEIIRSRAQIKAGVLMSLENTSSRAERVARQLQVCGRIIPIEEISQRIDAVSSEDVRRVAERLLSSAPTITALGPVGGLPDYEMVKAWLRSESRGLS